MVCNCERHFGIGKSLSYSAIFGLLLFIFPLQQQDAKGSLVNNSDNDYVITYSADGGFFGRHDFSWYNSSMNHLVSTKKINSSCCDLGTTDDLFDTQLSSIQQTNLTKMITDGNFFNISFNNDQPDCCDITYYELRIKMGDNVNRVTWTSGNIWNEDLPPIVTQIVNTLRQYTANSSHLFSESRME